MADKRITRFAWLAGITFSGILLKVGLLAAGVFPFNSDEAIVALMGRHILGGERPIFFYGQAYMGSLDAYLVAFFFSILGQAVWVIRLVQILLFVGTVITTFCLGKAIFKTDQAGLLAAALAAIPAVNVTLYTTVSLGGYGEALLIGNLILLLAIRVANHPYRLCQIIIFCFLVGLGLWTNGLTLVYSAPAVVYLLAKRLKFIHLRRRWSLIAGLAAGLTGFIAGSFPLWIYLFQMGPAGLVKEYLGSAVAVELGSWFAQAFNHLISLILLGLTAIFGFRPPWAVTWLVLPLAPFVLAFWVWIFILSIRKTLAKKDDWTEMLLLGAVLTLICIGFVATPFGADPSGRYFLPFGIGLALAAAGVIVSTELRVGRWKWGLAALLFIYQFSGNLQTAFTNPQSFTTQFDASTIIDHSYDDALIRFLEDNNEVRGYANYWISYPLAFLSNEDVIFTPRLPYHQDFRYTSRDDRYAPYDALVDSSGKIALITAHFQALDDQIRALLQSDHITWTEQVIGDYRVFYDLSEPVRAEEFGFEITGP